MISQQNNLVVSHLCSRCGLGPSSCWLPLVIQAKPWQQPADGCDCPVSSHHNAVHCRISEVFLSIWQNPNRISTQRTLWGEGGQYYKYPGFGLKLVRGDPGQILIHNRPYQQTDTPRSELKIISVNHQVHKFNVKISGPVSMTKEIPVKLDTIFHTFRSC